MPPIPTLPTDSLYKFIAFGGLVLFVVGQVMPPLIEQGFQDVKARIIETSIKQAEDGMFKVAEVYQRDKLEGEQLIEAVKNFSEAIDVRYGKEAKNAQDRIREYELTVKQQKSQLQICWWVGTILTPLGLVLWAWRVQLPQDKKLRADLELALSGLKGKIERRAGTPPLSQSDQKGKPHARK